MLEVLQILLQIFLKLCVTDHQKTIQTFLYIYIHIITLKQSPIRYWLPCFIPKIWGNWYNWKLSYVRNTINFIAKILKTNMSPMIIEGGWILTMNILVGNSKFAN